MRFAYGKNGVFFLVDNELPPKYRTIHYRLVIIEADKTGKAPQFPSDLDVGSFEAVKAYYDLK